MGGNFSALRIHAHVPVEVFATVVVDVNVIVIATVEVLAPVDDDLTFW